MSRSAPLVGGLTLALMTMPVIVIAGRNAIKSVPPSIRDAALGVGASKMQVTLHHVLPLALPGILTGTIIGVARALGETAPMLMTPNHLTVTLPDPEIAEASEPPVMSEPKMSARDVSVFYGDKQALKDVSIDVHEDRVTAFIGPSGCGKSTFLRCLNRMNDTIPGARVGGQVTIDGDPIYGPEVDPVALRRRIGMVFQKSNPFPKSVFDNVAFGPRVHG